MSETKTSVEWKEFLCPELVILDPDGWDRRKYEYSFMEEKVTKEEFLNRLAHSTLWPKTPEAAMELDSIFGRAL